MKFTRTVAMVGALAVGLTGLPLASAHDAVIESNPAANSHITELPEQLEITFSGVPQEGFNTIALSRDGEVLMSEAPEANGQTLTAPISSDIESAPGTYTVGYQITSSDGHATRGSYEFIVEGASEGAASSDTAAQGDNAGDNSRGVPSWLLPLGGIVVVAAALVMAIARWRGLKDD